MAQRVCILWREGPQATNIRALVYGDGKIRTYPADAIDGRARPDVFVVTLDGAIEALRSGDGKKIAVPVAVARRIGTPDWEFAE